MCGFVGFTGFDAEKAEEARVTVNKMMDAIAHRGPDSAGEFVGDGVALGFRRLSIIGLDDGYQPMFNEDHTIALLFNGEIYNYQSIKDELTEKGHVFSTHADSEVLLHAYEEHGDELTALLRGMFAFVIYDIPRNRILCVRDFFGIKPFYYRQSGGGFMFASEIKAFFPHPDFKKELNETALESYLSFQYSVHPETFFKGVYKLMPGHRLVYENGEVTVTRYFEPRFDPAEMSLESAVTAIDNVMRESVDMHRRVSDVEVGSFLSSGVDSSFVAARFNGNKTFTVGFDYDKYNEISYAKALSEKIGIENYSKTITTEEYWDILPTVQYHMDEPLADPAAVALFFVSQVASGHVKVALSGEGADEFFGGYNIYKEPLDLRILTSLPRPVRKLLGAVAAKFPAGIKGRNFFIRGSMNLEQRFIGNAKMFSKKERDAILNVPDAAPSPEEVTKPYYDSFKGYDDITKMQALDIQLWMVGDILLKADKMSMAHSLEVRVPFLDREVFKAASKIPTKYRVNKTDTKYAFRRAAAKYLPEEVAGKKKLGFPVPIRIWLREEKYYNKVKGYFTNETAGKYFRTERLLALLDGHKAGKADNSRKIWTVFMFLVWHERMFEE
ncbi:MAG: asparagine synthase (glutamine-hydrolyzing) [Defluviitaleaceae bacterium]|nr:asparagine synthase (glutamine-hydrolyzing) [Defluviitaleaceae bacterium]